MLQKEFTFEQGEKLLLSLLLAFPLIDFTLRKMLPFGAGLWDKTVLLFLLFFAVVKKIMSERPESGLKPAFVAYLILGLVFLVLHMPNFAISFEGFRATYQYMIAFFIGYYIFIYQQEWIRALRLVIAVGLLIAIYGLLQPFLGVQMPAGWVDAGESARFRAFSIVQSPNVLGSYMALLIPLVIGFFFFEKNRRWKVFWLFSMLILTICLLATLSRGAWLAFAASILFFSILIDRRMFIVALIAGLLVVTMVPQVSERISYLFSATYLEKSAEDGRIARWGGALDQVRNEPFFGRGLGHYGGAVAQRQLGITYVDNYYAKTMAETGLLGLTLYLWLLLSLLWKAYQLLQRYHQKDPRLSWILRGLLTGLVAVLLHNGVENIFEVPFMHTYFWFLAGSLLALPYLKDGDKEVAAGYE